MKRTSLVCLLLLLTALAVRVVSLGGQSVWWDEAFTWQSAGHGLTQLWQTQLAGDRNPPLYPLLAALWGSLAGWSEFSLRFLPLMLIIVGLAFAANLARRLFGSRAAVWTLALAALSPPLIGYAQEARAYALFFAATAATLYFALKIRDFGSIRPRRLWLALLMAEAALLTSHYFALPIVAALNVFVLIDLIRRRTPTRSIWWWLIGQFAAALPLAIWVTIVLVTPGTLARPAEAPPGLASFARQVLIFWLAGVRDLGQSNSVLTLIGGGWLLVSIAGAWQIDRRGARLGLGFGGLALIFAAGLTGVVTAFHPRYLLPYELLLLIPAGAAISLVSVPQRRWLGGVALLVAAGALLAGWRVMGDPAYARDDARGVAAFLRANVRPDDVILAEANDFTLDYYDHGAATLARITAADDAAAFRQLSAAVAGHDRVWLVHWQISTQDAHGYWPFLLEQSGELESWTSFHGYEVYAYRLKSPLFQPEPADAPQSFGAWAITRSAITSVDGAATVVVDWRRTGETGPAWTRASIGLVDFSGRALIRIDSDLREGRSYTVLPVPPGTPPLSARVTIKLYNAQAASDEITLGTIVPGAADEADPYRTLRGYAWRKVEQVIAPGLVLEAAAVGDVTPVPLARVDVTLRWRKTGDASHAEPRVRLAQADRVWAETGSALFENEYPVEDWAANALMIDRLAVTYPPVRGPMQLQVGVDDRWFDLETLTLAESDLKFEPPRMAHTQAAQFGDFAELLGYTPGAESIAADRPLPLTVYWRAVNPEPMTAAYTVFAQLIAPDGHLVAQHDAPPNPPTAAWVTGQVVVSSHTLTVVDPAYRGPAELIVGWYNSASVARVPASTGGDFVRLAAPVEVQER